MKIIPLLSILLTVSIGSGACNNNDHLTPADPPTENQEKPDEDNENAAPDNRRSLVVYFSCTNTTKNIARQIVEIIGGDSHQIIPETTYTSNDLNYNNSSSRANREQNDPASRPSISNKIDRFSDYDVVFLGYPIWWGKAPKIISTFLESYDFGGKTIVPFSTSHSSGIGSSDADLRNLAPQAIWKKGRDFKGNETKKEISNWLENAGLNQK